MKRFEQISDEDLNKKLINCFNCFIIIIFIFCLMQMEYSVFKVGEIPLIPERLSFVRHGPVHLAMFLQNVCIFSFQE
jgi:hypothetical protein